MIYWLNSLRLIIPSWFLQFILIFSYYFWKTYLTELPSILATIKYHSNNSTLIC
jgi:hypothetical protein